MEYENRIQKEISDNEDKEVMGYEEGRNAYDNE
jgi:hypothetical protein